MTEPLEDPEGAEETLTARDASRGMGPRTMRVDVEDETRQAREEETEGAAYSWVIYAPPEGMYAHRATLWVYADGQVKTTGDTAMGPLEMLRALFRDMGLAQFDRHPEDPDNIVEVWL